MRSVELSTESTNLLLAELQDGDLQPDENLVEVWVVSASLDEGVVSPNASDSPSKHCVPVHTVWRSRVLSSSCMPGRCGPFWQMQFMRSSHIVMAPTCGSRRGELSKNAAESEV